MINLTGGNIQTLDGIAVPNGSLTLQLNGDATVIATPGFVPASYSKVFKFGTDGNLLGSCKIWSNAELTPGTQYNVMFKDQNGARIMQTIWQFTQSSGSTVDIGTIVPAQPGSSTAAVSFSNTAANLVLAGPASGAAAFPTFRSLALADLPTLTAAQIPTLLNALQQFGATDTGLSRIAAKTLALGNGTQGDFTGTLKLALLLANTIQQITGTAFLLEDSTGGTRLSIPSNGTSQGVLNNTDILGGSALSGTGATDPLMPFNRLQANRGTSVVSGDFSISAASTGGGTWGTTASISSVSGNDTAGSIVISCSGTGQTVNAGFKFTFHDGAYPNVPVVMATRGDATGPTVPVGVIPATTGFVLFLLGTPVAGQTYTFYWYTIAK